MRAKSSIFVFLGILVSIFFLTLAYFQIDWTAFKAEFSRYPLVWFLGAMVFAILHNLLMAAKWKLLVSPFEKIPFSLAFWSLRLTYFLNSIFPARMGEPFRIWYVQKNSKISTARLIGATAAEKVMDLAVLVAIILVAVVIWGKQESYFHREWWWVLISLPLLVLLAWRLLPKKSNLKWVHKILEFLHQVHEGFSQMRQFPILWKLILLSVACVFCHLFMVLILAKGAQLDLTLIESAVIVGAVSVAITIPSGPANIGPFELAVIFVLTKLMGRESGASATVAVLYHFVQIIPTLCFGGLGLFLYRKKIVGQFRY